MDAVRDGEQGQHQVAGLAELEERKGEVGADRGVGEVDDPRRAVGHHHAQGERGHDGAAAQSEHQVGE